MSKREPYRVAPPRPLEPSEIKPPKPRKLLSNRVRGALCVAVSVGMAYAGALAKDRGIVGPNMSAVLNLTGFIVFIVMLLLFGAGLVIFFGPQDK